MSTAKFRGMITEFERYVPVPYESTWRNWKTGVGLRELLNNDTISSEDRLLSEMIQNMDFFALYRSIEFRKELKKRLEFHKSLLNGKN